MGSKVISFRFDDDKLALLQQHQVDGESENQAAMRLLLGVLGIEGKKPSIYPVDSIRNEIKESLANGDIKDAIANSYAAAMGQFNGLLEELQELQKQLQELQSNPPAAVPSSHSPITYEELPETTSPAVVLNPQSTEDRRYSKIVDWVCAQLNFGRLISDHFGSIDPITNQPCGELFDNEYLIEHNFHGQIAARKDELELRLGIKLVGSKARVTSDVKAILTALGFQFGHKQIKKKETYWVKNPQK